MTESRPDGRPAGSTGPRLVGRQPELGHLEGALDRVRAGDPKVVLIEGPSGIGKTALADHFLALVGEASVLRATGEEIEAELSFGVLDQLVAHVPAPLPEPLAALSAERGPVDPLVAGAALLDLLGELQHANPVLVVVDDAQWADAPSLHALTFALRRLRVDRVLTLILTQDAADPRLPDGLRRLLRGDMAVRLPLGGLDAEELRSLSTQLGAPLSPRASARLHDHTEGNPLYAHALLEQVPAEALANPHAALPAPRSFALLLLGRLASCRADVQALVVAASVLGRRCTLHQAARLAELADPLPALDGAIAAGLLVEQPDTRTIQFPHPLVHTAVYQQLSPARRADLHARAAELMTEESARLHHLARGAAGPDPKLSADLARFGRAKRVAGAWASAARHLSTAAGLTPGRRDREQLTLETVECRVFAGDLPDLAELTAAIRTFAESGWRSYILAMTAFIAGQVGDAEALLRDAWRRCSPDTDPVLGARVAGQLAAVSGLTFGYAEQVYWADQALRLAPDQNVIDLLHFLRLNGLGMSGKAAAALASVADLPDPAVASLVDLDRLLGRAMLRMWTDDLIGAREDLTGVLVAGHDQSVAFRILAETTLGLVHYYLGRWDDAVVHSELGASIATDAERPYLLPYSHLVTTLVLAARGDWDTAERHVQATRAGPFADHVVGRVTSAVAEAHLAHARGQPDRVIAALGPLTQLDRRDMIDQPGHVVWRVLLVDALVAAGKLDEAEAVLTPFEAIGHERRHHSAMASAARARGKLEAARGNTDLAAAAFRSALDHSDHLSMPFDRALIQLDYGAFLRRAGQKTAAAVQLRSARDALNLLRSRPHLARCERELAACGLRPTRRRKPDDVRLTPQEQAVGRLAASGLSNRQIARELVVSVKTVEYHLSHVYTKLQIASRVQLALRLSRS